jgi:TQXA domain-containing protein
MAGRLKLARAGAAVVGASVTLMMAAAIPAGAEPATGKVDGNAYTHGYHVNVGPDHDDMNASLIGFELSDGTKLQMYCVEINTNIDKKHQMAEKPWDSYPNAESPFNANRAKINWVLHNGYPVIAADALATLLTSQGVSLTNGIDEKEAISATQAAVWHFSDGMNLDQANPLPKGPQDAKADVLALYNYLTGDANVGIGDQPTPALAVAPDELTGEAGKRIGPFTVSTTGDIQKLTTELPDGVKITDVDGVELTADKIKNGAALYLDVPAGAQEGAGTFSLTATASVDTGRLFVGENYGEKKTQSLIVATAESSEIVAAASAKWTVTPTTTTETTPPSETETTTTEAPSTTPSTPAPQPKANELAETGASIFTPILIGLVLVGAGVGALFFQRHRKRA